MRRIGWAVILASAACTLPAAAADPYLFDDIKKPAYSRALTSLLQGARGLPAWTRKLLRPRGDYLGSTVEYASRAGPFPTAATAANELPYGSGRTWTPFGG